MPPLNHLPASRQLCSLQLCMLLLLSQALLSLGRANQGRRSKDLHLMANAALNDVLFTDQILFPLSQTRSLLDCLRRCFSGDRCRAITFVETSVGSSCQGYSRRVGSENSHVGHFGARTFVFPALPDWINTACASHADCEGQVPDQDQDQADQLPVCHQQRCLCPYGYFYSLSLKCCLEDCPDDQLQPSYTMMYASAGIISRNQYPFSTGDVEDCKRLCTAVNDCENFQTFANGSCVGSPESEAQFWTTGPFSDVHLRDCA